MLRTAKNKFLQDQVSIPNINIGKVYDQRYIDSSIHVENLRNLATFFGRNMPVHHHDRFYQIHLVLNGTVRVNLEDTSYTVQAPMFFLTPPTIPHSFIIENDAEGYVVTAQQQVVWELVEDILVIDWQKQSLFKQPICTELHPSTDKHANKLIQILEMMIDEQQQTNKAQVISLRALLQLTLVCISNLSTQQQSQIKTSQEEVRIFHTFNKLIEANYRIHKPLPYYAGEIGITEARLNEICQHLSGLTSKKLIDERLLQEAKRLLIYSTASVSTISYELGFKDPAYFARFFRKKTGLTAGEYRREK